MTEQVVVRCGMTEQVVLRCGMTELALACILLFPRSHSPFTMFHLIVSSPPPRWSFPSLYITLEKIS